MVNSKNWIFKPMEVIHSCYLTKHFHFKLYISLRMTFKQDELYLQDKEFSRTYIGSMKFVNLLNYFSRF